MIVYVWFCPGSRGGRGTCHGTSEIGGPYGFWRSESENGSIWILKVRSENRYRKGQDLESERYTITKVPTPAPPPPPPPPTEFPSLITNISNCRPGKWDAQMGILFDVIKVMRLNRLRLSIYLVFLHRGKIPDHVSLIFHCQAMLTGFLYPLISCIMWFPGSSRISDKTYVRHFAASVFEEFIIAAVFLLFKLHNDRQPCYRCDCNRSGFNTVGLQKIHRG